MCGFFNAYDYPFKWITYLVVVIGIYTFLYWLLAIPLLYFHFYECCNEKQNWIAWFLGAALVIWLGISTLIILIWFCLRFIKLRHLNGSNVRLTEKKEVKNKEKEAVEKAKTVFLEKSKVDISGCSLESIRESPTEIVDLPRFDSKDSFTVLQMNDSHRVNEESAVSSLEFPIPVDENRHYVQNEPPQSPESEGDAKPLKTPREIFFKDLIESAPKSPLYFDFDPEKISNDLKKKYELDKSEEKAEDNPRIVEGNHYSLGSSADKQNLTSEGRENSASEPELLHYRPLN